MALNENKQTVLVLGGTGLQGGGVVNALLKNPEKWNIRVLSRNPQSEKAIELQKRGCQVVKGDFDAHDELVKSLEGVDFVFLVTNFWQPPFTKEAEFAQGKKFADAAAKHSSKLKAIVFSGLPHAEKISNGKIKVEHFDSKGEIEIYLRDLKLPYISVGLGYYMENFGSYFSSLEKQKDQYVLNFPMKPEDRLPLAHVDEYGPIVVSVFENFKEHLGKSILVVTESIPIQKVAQTIQEVTGHQIHLSNITPELYAKIPGIPSAGELAEMFKFFFSIYSDTFQKDTDFVKKIIGKPITWKEFVEKNWKNWPIFK